MENSQDLIRIRREIQIMSSIHHPHIIHIYEGTVFYKFVKLQITSFIFISIWKQRQDSPGDAIC